MNPSIKIRQHDITDCGAACLASVAAHYGLKFPIARIRQYASTNQKGTNVLGLVEAAQRLGFQAKGVKGSLESLSKIPKPTIAHVNIAKENGAYLLHYVVIYKVSDKHIWVMDPADGKLHKKLLTDFAKEWTGVLVLLLPDEDFEIGNEKVSIFRRFTFLLYPHRFVLLQALFGAVIYTVLGLSTAIYIQKITDNVITEGNQNLLNLLSIVMIVLLLLQLFIGAAKSIFAFKTGQQIDAQLILGYYKHLLKLPQQFFDTMRVGEIISRVNDAVKIRLFINDVAINLLVNVFIVLFAFALMFTYYWKLALVMLIILPLYVFIYWIANQINKRLQRKLMEDAAQLETQLVESLNAVATIKRFGLESYANLKTENKFIQLLKTIYKSGISSLYIGTASDFISRLFTIIILWVGTYYVIQNELTPGELLSFYALIGYFTGPAMSLIEANKSIQDAWIAADRLFEIMDLEQEDQNNKVSLTPDLVGDILFRQVSFKYGSRAKVFDSLDLKIEKGKTTAIVGESGSGKSTLLSLLQNLYPISSGNIFIGNLDLQYIKQESLRRVVSVVPQQIDLFAGSIIENIAIGDFEPDMQRVLQISEVLGITEFVKGMPEGFHTMLGERGMNLSGGQRQRIAIARALYQNPEILILDEATSALDSISERYVQQALAAFQQNQKTIIVIAHRLSTIKHADKIIALSEGKLAEEGTHTELLAQKGVYYDLWQQQFESVGFEV
jgi:ATP-binding cassette subfamily B protein